MEPSHGIGICIALLLLLTACAPETAPKQEEAAIELEEPLTQGEEVTIVLPTEENVTEEEPTLPESPVLSEDSDVFTAIDEAAALL